MTSLLRAVAVMQLPERVNRKRGRLFLRELEHCMNIDRPCIVLDCSQVLQMDRSAIHLLLCCLEETIKRNGDAKLAAIPADAGSLLELTGVNRLFEIFETNAEAVKSFNRAPMDVSVPLSLSERASRISETRL